jgi:hypothetical protein
MMNEVPEQGGTLRTDLCLPGAIICSDASWKCRKVPETPEETITGIGVFIGYKAEAQHFSIMVQASTNLTSSVDEDLKLKQKAFYLQPDCRRF